MKLWYLIKRSFSTSFFREMIIICLSMYMIFSLTAVLIPIGDTQTTYKTIEDSFLTDTIYYQPSLRIGNILTGMTLSDTQDVDVLRDEIAQSLSQIEGVVSIGETSHLTVPDVFGDDQSTALLVYYNQALRENTLPPLASGSWFTTENESGDYLPVVVGGTYRDSCQVGDVFEATLDAQTDSTITCIIVGILDEQDLIYQLNYGATNPTLDSIAYMNQLTSLTDGGIIIVPMEAVSLYPEQQSVSKFLFLDSDYTATSIETAYEASSLGSFYSVQTMYKTVMNNLSYQYGKEIVIALALVLFGLFGLGGYTLLTSLQNERTIGIYYLCGMKRSTAILMQILTSVILTVIPVGLMLLLSPYYAERPILADNTTLFFCIVTTILILSLSAGISIYRTLKTDRLLLLKGE